MIINIYYWDIWNNSKRKLDKVIEVNNAYNFELEFYYFFDPIVYFDLHTMYLMHYLVLGKGHFFLHVAYLRKIKNVSENFYDLIDEHSSI